MGIKKLAIVFVGIVMLGTFTPQGLWAATANHWVIKTSDFECLKTNVEKYLASSKSKIIIFLNDCPETDIAKIVAKYAKNSSNLPEIDKQPQTADSPAEVISVNRKFLRCIGSIETSANAAVVRVPKNLCN